MKLGQPVPLSYFVFEVKSGRWHAAHTYRRPSRERLRVHGGVAKSEREGSRPKRQLMKLRRSCVNTATLTGGTGRLPTCDVGVLSTPPLGSTVRSADYPSRHLSVLPCDRPSRRPLRTLAAGARRADRWSAARSQQPLERPYIRIACETTDHANRWFLAHACSAACAGARSPRRSPLSCQYQLARRAAGAATGTINRETSALHRMGTLAVHWGWLDTVLGFPDRLRENPPRQGFFEHPEYLAVRAHLPAPWQDILDLAYYSGWRKNEILGLTWDEIDEAGGSISPPHRRRAGPTADTPWRTACQAAGVPIRFLHDCRRPAAPPPSWSPCS